MPMNFTGLSPAGAALGLGRIPGLGDALTGQVADETEELRRKRMQEAQQRQLLGVSGGSSAAASSLFSPLFGGVGRGY